MKRYKLRQGKLRPHNDGEWVEWQAVYNHLESLEEASDCPPDVPLLQWLGMQRRAADKQTEAGMEAMGFERVPKETVG